MHSSGHSDPLVVATVDLATVVRRWIEEFDALHPNKIGPEKDPHVKRNGRDEILKQGTIGGLACLSFWSQIPERRIRGIVNCETKFTTLRVADQLLQAMDRSDLIHTELSVVPNPQWTETKWRAWAATCEETPEEE